MYERAGAGGRGGPFKSASASGGYSSPARWSGAGAGGSSGQSIVIRDTSPRGEVHLCSGTTESIAASAAPSGTASIASGHHDRDGTESVGSRCASCLRGG